MAVIKNWMDKLMGRSALDVKKVGEQMQQETPGGGSADAASENPIEQDLQKLSSSVKSVSGKLKEKVKPAVSRQTQKATSKLKSTKKIGKKSDMKKFFVIFAVVLVLFIVTITASKVVPVLQNQNRSQPKDEGEPTPTPATFDTYQPSVYADDPEVLKLEEDISIFEREVSTVNLRHSELFPPTIDFKISF